MPILPSSVGAAKISTDQKREINAGKIGMVIVIVFGITVCWLLVLGTMLLAKFSPASLDDFGKFVTGSLNPFLKECATTVGTIFGSTLGFVLGYYFKASSSNSGSTSGTSQGS